MMWQIMKKSDFLIRISFVDIIFQPIAGIIAPDNMFVINFKNANTLYSKLISFIINKMIYFKVY